VKPSIFVSGFARTGTTTMMRMLEAGGIPVLADKRSTKDMGPHHPTGIYELHDAGQLLLEKPATWTEGKAIKLVAQYMDFLPLDRPLKVLFMVRDVNEIVASLLAMKVIWENDPITAINNARRLLRSWDVPFHDVHYHTLLKYPKSESARIADFLEMDLDIDAMAAVVDPKSRRKAFKDRDPELVTYEVDRNKLQVLG